MATIDIDIEELLADDDIDDFFDILEKSGFAVAIVETGVIVGANKERLTKLLELANNSDDGTISLFIENNDEAIEVELESKEDKTLLN